MTESVMKRIIFSCIVFLAGSVSASWMGETWLWVRVEKTFPHKYGSDLRKVTLKVLNWAMGAGHGDWYGSKFPGRSFTVNLKCRGLSRARQLKVGEEFWVKHHASSCFGRDPKTGRRRGYSHSSWKNLELGLWAYRPVVVKNLLRGEELALSPRQNLLWAIRHGNNVTLKIRHETQKRWDSKWRIYIVKGTQTSVTLAVVFSNHRRQGVYHRNPRTEQDKLLQFSAAAFKGKEIRIQLGGKIVAVLK